MVKKYRRMNHFNRMASPEFKQRKTSRARAALQLSRQGTAFQGWPTTLVASAMALGLVAATPAWADIPVRPEKTPSLSISEPSYLTEVLPPYLPPDFQYSVQNRATLSKGEILFIDQGVSDYQSLIDSMAREIEVVFLAPDRDGVSAIAEHLQGRTDLRGIHIVSHGGPGRIYLGNMVLTAGELAKRHQDLLMWSKALGPGGDVLLYGCDVAKGLEGIRFVNRLAHTLTAGISASDDPTGSPTMGGDWGLEYRRDVETETIFATSVDNRFHALLADGQVIAGDGSGGGGGGGGGSQADIGGAGGAGGHGGGDADTLIGTDGNDVIFGDGSGGGGGGGGGGPVSYGKYGPYSGYPGQYGQGGSGADVLNGGGGDDILFGDGFNGQSGSPGLLGPAGNGGEAGFGNYGAGGHGQDNLAQGGTDGSIGIGGALGGAVGTFGTNSGKYNDPGTDGQPGESGSTDPLNMNDTGGTLHAHTMAKIASGDFNNLYGGGGKYASGNDVLDGGPGSDALFGMGGINTFVFETNDATSGSDVDTIYNWNNGPGNQIDLRIGGDTFDSAQVDTMVASQTAAGQDRLIVHVDVLNQVTIVVKDLDRDLTASDFVIGAGANFSPFFTGTPAIIGTARAGGELALEHTETEDPDGDTVTLSYQWLANGADIASATSATYKVSGAEHNKTITCTITASDGNGGVTPYTTTGVEVISFPWTMFMPAITGMGKE